MIQADETFATTIDNLSVSVLPIRQEDASDSDISQNAL